MSYASIHMPISHQTSCPQNLLPPRCPSSPTNLPPMSSPPTDQPPISSNTTHTLSLSLSLSLSLIDNSFKHETLYLSPLIGQTQPRLLPPCDFSISWWEYIPVNVINLILYRPVRIVPEQKQYMFHYVLFRPTYLSVPASSGHFPDLVRYRKQGFRKEEDEEKEEEKRRRREEEERTKKKKKKKESYLVLSA